MKTEYTILATLAKDSRPVVERVTLQFNDEPGKAFATLVNRSGVELCLDADALQALAIELPRILKERARV